MFKMNLLHTPHQCIQPRYLSDVISDLSLLGFSYADLLFSKAYRHTWFWNF